MKEYKYRENINDNDGNTVGVREMVVPNNIVGQIRADAIDEFVTDYINEEPNYCDDCNRGEEEYCCIKCFKDKWLKEQKNE